MIRRVVIESPYAGDVNTHVRYARRCVRDALQRGESPLASHLLYPQEGILDDDVPEERAWGIEAGFEWMDAAEAVVFYVDYGMSNGMADALVEATVKRKVKIEARTIGRNP